MKILRSVVPALVLAAALPVVTAGCGGETSYFDVNVTVTGAQSTDLTSVETCEIETSGASSSVFTLQNCGRGRTMQDPQHFGYFLYRTDADGGDVTFKATLFGSSRSVVGMSDAKSAAIVKGKHVPVSLAVTWTGATP